VDVAFVFSVAEGFCRELLTTNYLPFAKADPVHGRETVDDVS
jgi:hypothetical protein